MSAAIQGIYVALFGRPADPGGLAYWTEVTKNGADLSAMLNVLPSLPEYTSRFEGMTNSEVVSTIYQSLFGRAPDAEGLAFFVEALTTGSQSIGTIAVHILNGAQGTDKADVDAKIDAAQQFTAALDTEAEIDAYNADAVASAQSFLDGINRDNPATQESVNSAVEVIVNPDEGQAPGGGGVGGGGDTDPEPSFENSYGDLQATYGEDELYVGHSNPTNGFFISYNAEAKLELALDVRFDQIPDEVAPSDLDSATFVVPINLAHELRFAWSAAYLGDGDLDLSLYDIKLTLVDGPNDTTNSLTLGEDTAPGAHSNNEDSAFDWYYEDTPFIVDDGGNTSVSQNIQKLDWTDLSYSAGDTYQVKLEAFLKGTNTLAASTNINIEYEAATDTVVNINGSNPNHTGIVPGDAVDGIYWIRDRQAPESFSVVDGELVLTIDTDGHKADDFVLADSQGRAVPFASYQGYKLTDGDAKLGITIDESHAVSISFDFYIDAAWADDEGLEQAVSFWPFARNDDNQLFYPIIDYVDADAATTLAGRWANDDTVAGQAGFRIWDSSDLGSWGHFTAADEDLFGWVNLKLLIEHDQVTWVVSQGDDEIARFTQEGSAQTLETLAFQGLNFGEDQTYKIDNLRVDTISNTWDLVA